MEVFKNKKPGKGRDKKKKGGVQKEGQEADTAGRVGKTGGESEHLPEVMEVEKVGRVGGRCRPGPLSFKLKEEMQEKEMEEEVVELCDVLDVRDEICEGIIYSATAMKEVERSVLRPAVFSPRGDVRDWKKRKEDYKVGYEKKMMMRKEDIPLAERKKEANGWTLTKRVSRLTAEIRFRDEDDSDNLYIRRDELEDFFLIARALVHQVKGVKVSAREWEDYALGMESDAHEYMEKEDKWKKEKELWMKERETWKKEKVEWEQRYERETKEARERKEKSEEV